MRVGTYGVETNRLAEFGHCVIDFASRLPR